MLDTIVDKIETEPHELYTEFKLFNKGKHIDSIDIDLSTILNARGFNFKKAFIHSTVRDAIDLSLRPIEWFKENR